MAAHLEEHLTKHAGSTVSGKAECVNFVCRRALLTMIGGDGQIGH